MRYAMKILRVVALMFAWGVVAPIALCAAVISIFLYSNWSRSMEPLPPLLQQITAGGGNSGACWHPERGTPNAPSSSLDARLQAQFPAGSKEADLVDALMSQRFSAPQQYCKGEPSVRSASFSGCSRDESGKVAMVYQAPIWAVVFWKVDDAGLIVATWSSVSYKC